MGKSLCFCNGLPLCLGSRCTFATGYFCVWEAFLNLENVTFVFGTAFLNLENVAFALGRLFKISKMLLLCWDGFSKSRKRYFCVGETFRNIKNVTFVRKTSPCYRVFFENSRLGRSLCFCNGLLLRWGGCCVFATGCLYVWEVVVLLQRLAFALGRLLCFCNGLLLRWGSHCAFAMGYFHVGEVVAFLQRLTFALGRLF